MFQAHGCDPAVGLPGAALLLLLVSTAQHQHCAGGAQQFLKIQLINSSFHRVKTVASSALNADGQEPWLVVWKKGQHSAAGATPGSPVGLRSTRPGCSTGNMHF